MALYYSKDGFPFLAPPYTNEENWEFEQRLRRGGDITIIRQRRPARPELSTVNDQANGEPTQNGD
jgi:hypothetical protein